MKTLPPLLLAVLLGAATACQKEIIPAAPEVVSANPLTQAFFVAHPLKSSIKNIASVDLMKLTPSKETTKFKVSIQTSEGQALAQGTSLQPNTSYRVLVQGESPARFVLKMAESFEVVQAPPVSEAMEAVYLIKTNADIPAQLYLSVVPLHTEQNTLTKGHPVGFLLPN
jgi:hypothetical protein